MQVLIDKWDKKKIWLFFIFYFFLIIIGLVIGATGPERYEKKIFENEIDNTVSNISTFEIKIDELNRLNQHLFIDSFFLNGQDLGITETVTFTVNLWGKRNQNISDTIPDFDEESTLGMSSSDSDDDDKSNVTEDDWDLIESSSHKREIECESKGNCTTDTILYLSYLHFETYFLKVEYDNSLTQSNLEKIFIEVYYTHSMMTIFELFWRYFFIMTVILWIYYITRKTHNISFHNFSYELKWLYVLLCLLLLFNNPFWALLLLDHTAFVQVLNSFLVATFVILYSAFYLYLIDGYRYSAQKRTTLKFYLPKSIPLVGLWITFITIFLITRFHQHDDPQYETVNDVTSFFVVSIFFWLLYIVYFLWLIYSSIRAFKEIKDDKKKRFYFFFPFFIITTIMYLISFIGDYIQSIRNTTLEFTSHFTIFNFSIIALSIAFLPTSKSRANLSQDSHEKLEEEEENDDTESNQNEKIILSDNSNYELESQSSSKSQSEKPSSSD
ncbi:transmembrane protein [Anaeramoeba flamelloides]|uniref:Transmembrane protein n=1 Tax=Anaeramoeba flamelloides TaxID=1746091 RepID=A0AAV7YMQ1_9EUKA|nr:transmembrane protein [Anaeramoeba flamelloides]